MNRKRMFYITLIILIVFIVITGIYFKMKKDEYEKGLQKYYIEQQERINLFFKYNVKNKNDFKSINFTDIHENRLDGFVIEGYLNNDKTLSFSASMYSKNNYQFEGDMMYSKKTTDLLNEHRISVSKIKEA